MQQLPGRVLKLFKLVVLPVEPQGPKAFIVQGPHNISLGSAVIFPHPQNNHLLFGAVTDISRSTGLLVVCTATKNSTESLLVSIQDCYAVVLRPEILMQSLIENEPLAGRHLMEIQNQGGDVWLEMNLTGGTRQEHYQGLRLTPKQVEGRYFLHFYHQPHRKTKPKPVIV